MYILLLGRSRKNKIMRDVDGRLTSLEYPDYKLNVTYGGKGEITLYEDSEGNFYDNKHMNFYCPYLVPEVMHCPKYTNFNERGVDIILQLKELIRGSKLPKSFHPVDLVKTGTTLGKRIFYTHQDNPYDIIVVHPKITFKTKNLSYALHEINEEAGIMKARAYSPSGCRVVFKKSENHK